MSRVCKKLWIGNALVGWASFFSHAVSVLTNRWALKLAHPTKAIDYQVFLECLPRFLLHGFTVLGRLSKITPANASSAFFLG